MEGDDETELDPAADTPDPERASAGREVGRAIRDCLGLMVRPRRLAVTLNLQGHSVPEIGRLLGWTGKKAENKRYFSHSMYPGGLRWRSITEVRAAHPDRVVRNAVRGMLPKNRLGRALIKKLKVYGSAEHPHQAQRPSPLPRS